MPVWILIPVLALPLFAIGFLFLRRSAMLTSLDPESGGVDAGMLKQLGIDPTKPVRLEFTLSFPTHESAVAAAAGFPSPQWRTTLGTVAGDEGWPCTARTESVVNKAILDALITLCREVASANGGTFHRWQVQVLG